MFQADPSNLRYSGALTTTHSMSPMFQGHPPPSGPANTYLTCNEGPPQRSSPRIARPEDRPTRRETKRLPYVYIFPQNLKVLKGRGDLYPCCYDLEWTEITARGDRRPNLLLSHFQIISNNSKAKWNVDGKFYLTSSGLSRTTISENFQGLKSGDIICHQNLPFLGSYLK